MSRTISTNISGGLTLTTTTDSPVYIAAGVGIANTSGPAALIETTPFNWSVTNGPGAQIAGYKFGVSLTSPGTVVNQGAITASYTVGRGFAYNTTTHVLTILSAALYVGGGGVSNSHTGIVAGYLGVALGGAGSVVNAGTIEDTVAGKGAGVVLATGGSVTNLTGGTITGGNYGILTDGAAGVSNQSGATITGTRHGIFMVNGSGSVGNLGNISGGFYGVQVAGGAGSVTNNATIDGTTVSGIRLSDGGGVSNQSSGAITGGEVGVLIENAAGLVTNQGLIQERETFANQKFALAGVFLVNGGTVDNEGGTITGASYGIDVANAVGTVTNTGMIASLRTAGGYGVILLEGGTVGNSGTIGSQLFGVEMVYAPGTVTNNGLVVTYGTGAGAGINLLQGGSAANGGTIRSRGYGIEMMYAAGSVTNSGLIASYGGPGVGAGVDLPQGGSVTNSGTIHSQFYGIEMVAAPGTVTNSGVVASYVAGTGAGMVFVKGGSVTNASGGFIAGGFIGVQFGAFPHGTVTPPMAPAGTLLNQGNISASDDGGDGAAVWLHGPGVIINQTHATIEGAINGTIVGGPLNGFSNGGFGVVAYYQTTLINYGSIGGTRFAFDAANSLTAIGNLVEMAPGASFGGVVLGAYNAVSAPLSTLELRSGASAGTVTNFGTQYKNFGNVTLDNGARWNLGGTVAAGTVVAFAGTGALTFVNPLQMQGTISGFSLGDTIGLNGVTVSGSNYAGGVLTLTEAAANPVSLNVSGPFTTANFAVTNVSGNAEVSFVQTQNRTLIWTGGADSAFAAAANWDDIINGFNPAQAAPNPTDTVMFDSSGGAVTGTGTVAALDVGSAGSGGLQITGGSTIVAGSFDAGIVAAAFGQIGLTGNGSALTMTGTATVGDSGTGILSVSNGATFAAAALVAGAQGKSSGGISLSGTGAALRIGGVLTIGGQSSGSLNLANGASVTAGGLNIGAGASGSGIVVIGPGSHLSLTTTIINVGLAGSGVLDVQGGTLGLVQGTTLSPGTFGRIVQVGGLIDPAAVFDASGGSFGGGGTAEASTEILNSSLATVSGLAETLLAPLITSGDTVNLGGVWSIKAGGTLVLDANVVDNSQTISFGDTTGELVIGQQVTLDATQTPRTIAASALSGFQAPIVGFKTGDAIGFAGLTIASDSVTGNVMTLFDSGNVVLGTLTFQTAKGGADNAGAAAARQQIVPCFVRGTSIETAAGPCAVESLIVGDEAIVRLGGSGRIVWIGSRTVDCARHPKPETVWPVRIVKDAFGPEAPRRDLLLSPDHAVFVNGALVPVKLLVNGTSIAQEARPTVTYYHVELPEHAVILAEGLSVESYLDVGDRANFEQAGAAVRLFPDFSARTWEMEGCAPLILTGPLLERLRRALARGEAVVASGASRHGSRPARVPWARLNNRYTYY